MICKQLSVTLVAVVILLLSVTNVRAYAPMLQAAQEPITPNPTAATDSASSQLDLSTAIELLRIACSWPVVILVIFLFLINPIRRVVYSLEYRPAKIPTPLGAVELGELAHPVTEEIPEELRQEAPEQVVEELVSRRQRLFPGLAEIYIFTGTVVRSVSGFVISESGYMISEGIFLGQAQEALVRLAGEDRSVRAKVVGISSDRILALLQLPDNTHPAMRLASQYELGERVDLVSAHGGVVQGVISSSQGVQRIQLPDGPAVIVRDVLKVECLPPRGFAGAPLLNEQHEVVGVAYASTTQPPEVSAVSSRRIISEFEIFLARS